MSKSFCIMPWITLHPVPSGQVNPCCIWPRDMEGFGNINEQSLDEIATGPAMNELRRKFLNDEYINGCDLCFTKEAAFKEDQLNPAVSPRLHNNNRFKHLIKEALDNTNPDGSLKAPFKMKTLNIRWSNLCNCACRSCGPTDSSLWGQQVGIKNPVRSLNDFNTNLFEQLKEHLPYLEKINFVGGEPLLIDEHWLMLEELIKVGNIDLEIHTNSNMNKITYKNKSIIDYIKKFKNYRLFASIDAMGERAEVYRFGTNWAAVEENMRAIKNAGCELRINSTVGAVNILHIMDVQKWVFEHELVKPENFYIYHLENPQHLNLRIFPPAFKTQVEEKVLEHIEWCKDNDVPIIFWENAIKLLHYEFNEKSLKHFIVTQNHLNKVQGKNLFDAFPELIPLVKHALTIK